MGKRDGLSKTLALVGSTLVLLPLVAPVVLSAVRFAQAGRLQLDYLMPAELFLVALVGGVLLLWAALRARSHMALVAWSFGAAAGLLASSMAVASLTGLASGAAEPSGWRIVVVVGLLVGYILALVVLAATGVMLVVSLFRPTEKSEPAAT